MESQNCRILYIGKHLWIPGSDPVLVAGIHKAVTSASCDSTVCVHVSDSSSDLLSWLQTQAMVPNHASFGSAPKLGKAGVALKPPAAANTVPTNRAEGTLHTGAKADCVVCLKTVQDKATLITGY